MVWDSIYSGILSLLADSAWICLPFSADRHYSAGAEERNMEKGLYYFECGSSSYIDGRSAGGHFPEVRRHH